MIKSERKGRNCEKPIQKPISLLGYSYCHYTSGSTTKLNNSMKVQKIFQKYKTKYTLYNKSVEV